MLKIGDYVAEPHGVPLELDYGVILGVDGDRRLMYDPFRNWQHWVHRNELVPVSNLSATRTGYALEDGTRVVHDVAEALVASVRSGRFTRRDGQ